MPAESSVPNALEKIVKLKRTINPATGRNWSSRDIGKLYGKTGMWVRYMTRKLTGCCPNCLRPLESKK